jgi:hypothetical protein
MRPFSVQSTNLSLIIGLSRMNWRIVHRGLIEIFWLVSNIGCWKPMSIDNEKGGKLSDQNPQGLTGIGSMGEAS